MEARDDICKNLSRLPAHGSLDLFISFQRHKLFTCVFAGCLPKSDSCFFFYTNTSFVILNKSSVILFNSNIRRCKYLLRDYFFLKYINILRAINKVILDIPKICVISVKCPNYHIQSDTNANEIFFEICRIIKQHSSEKFLTVLIH